MRKRQIAELCTLRILFNLLILFMLSISILLLAGCGQKLPATTRDGEPWSTDWIPIGTTLGIDPPGNGLSLLDNKDTLSASDLYYAAWVIGEGMKYENADGESVNLYDAQLYLLLQNCGTGEKAASTVTDWQAAETDIYQVSETRSITCAGQEFTVLLYQVDREENPYARGASAFCIYENYALNVELACVDSFEEDILRILTDFLEGIHYA